MLMPEVSLYASAVVKPGAELFSPRKIQDF